MRINVKLSKGQQTIAKLSGLGAILKTNIDNAIHASAVEGRNVAAESAPYLRGDLKRSITVNKVSDYSYEVNAHMPYAAIHEFGGTITINEVVYIPAVGFRFISTVRIGASGYMAKGRKAAESKGKNLVDKAIDHTFKAWR